jgi:hypothetical protein
MGDQQNRSRSRFDFSVSHGSGAYSNARTTAKNTMKISELKRTANPQRMGECFQRTLIIARQPEILQISSAVNAEQYKK